MMLRHYQHCVSVACNYSTHDIMHHAVLFIQLHCYVICLRCNQTKTMHHTYCQHSRSIKFSIKFNNLHQHKNTYALQCHRHSPPFKDVWSTQTSFYFLFIELKQRFYSVLFLHIIMVVCVVCPLFVPFQCYLLLVLCRPYGEQKYISIRFSQVQ